MTLTVSPRLSPQDLVRRFPDADARLCARNMEHAFVLEFSISMAEVLWDWMCEAMPFLTRK